MSLWYPSTISNELRGRPLRYLLITFLAEARRPLSVQELIARCHAEGVAFDGRPSKIISDALRWELRSGRARRIRRGVYRIGHVPRSTMRWIHHRVAQAKRWLEWTSSKTSLRSLDPPLDSPLDPLRDSPPRVWTGPSWVPLWPLWTLGPLGTFETSPN